jgi:hypothetical protein
MTTMKEGTFLCIERQLFLSCVYAKDSSRVSSSIQESSLSSSTRSLILHFNSEKKEAAEASNKKRLHSISRETYDDQE